MIRNEDGVGPDRRDDHRAKRQRPAAGFDGGPFAVLDAVAFCEPRVDLDSRLRILLDERADAPSLRTGQKLADDASGREETGNSSHDVVTGAAIFRNVEPGFAVGKVKAVLCLSQRVVASGSNRRGVPVVDGSPLWIFAVARPKDAHLTFDFFVGDARIVCHPALARTPQLVEDLAGLREREALGRPSARAMS